MKGESTKRQYGLVRLIAPHAKPYLGVLTLVLFLGGLSALAQQGVLLLLSPTWQVLFPAEVAAPAPEAPESPGLGEHQLATGFESMLEGWRATATEWALGVGPGELTDDLRMSLLLRVALIVTLIAIVAGIAQYGFTLLSRWAGLKMIVALRLRIARHLMGLSLRYHGRRHFGDLLSRISSDVTATLNVIEIGMRDLVQEPLLAITALGMALLVSPAATLTVVLGLPLLIIPIALLMRRVRKGSHKSMTQLGASVQALSQMFQGIRTVKAFRAEEREVERYHEINNKYVRATMKMVRAMALSRSWTILYTHAGLGLMLLLVGWLKITQDNFDSGGDMLLFFLLISKVYSSLKITLRGYARVEEARGACQRLGELLDEQPDVVEHSEARSVSGLGEGIRLEGVSFAYADGDRNALEDIDLEIRPGETLALVGPSGSGKSTFIDLVARFVDPTAGRLTVDGMDLREVSFDSWARQFAMVTQEPFLFHASIEENILYGREAADADAVRAAASAANIHEFIEGLPGGYATDVADAGARLSGGQRQRITIARAILHGGPLLLLDEATSALDTESEQVVQEAIEALMAEHTVIVIAHRLSTVRRADRIAVLDAGRVVELGTHADLVVAGGLYASLYEAQFGREVRA